MRAIVYVLGSGGSLGVPVVGCDCIVCSSPSPRNQRLRPALLLRVADRSFLIDVGPDFRYQALAYQIVDLEGVLLTHPHYDHIAGIDDLRPLFFKKGGSLPCLLSIESCDEVTRRYDYLLGKRDLFDFQRLEGEVGRTEFQGLQVGYLSYRQSGMKVTGFRFGNFAYVTDIKQYEESIFESLQGVEILVLSGRRQTRSPSHLSVKEALALGERVGARQVYLTHLSHEMESVDVNSVLPPHVNLAYDGLEIEVEVDYVVR